MYETLVPLGFAIGSTSVCFEAPAGIVIMIIDQSYQSSEAYAACLFMTDDGQVGWQYYTTIERYMKFLNG